MRNEKGELLNIEKVIKDDIAFCQDMGCYLGAGASCHDSRCFYAVGCAVYQDSMKGGA